MPPIPINFPERGVTNLPAFIKTPGDAAPLGSTYNVLPTEELTGRMRGSKRMGIVRVFPGPIGPGAVQGLGVITRASNVSGQRLGTATDLTDGTSLDAAFLEGQVFGLDSAPSLDFAYSLDVSPAGPFGDDGPTTNGVQAIAFSAAGTGLNRLQKAGKYLAVGSNYFSAGDGFLVCRIVLIDTDTGRVIGTRRLSQAGAATPTFQFVNQMCATDRRLYVCTNNWVNVYRIGPESAPGAMDGLVPLSESVHNCNGWANAAVQCALSPDGAYLYVGFHGTGQAATLPSGVTVTGGINGTHFRSGVMRYRTGSDAPHLTPVAWSPQLPVTARYYEGPVPYNPHNYWRLSEKLPRAPRGGLITALAVDSAGNVIVTHTNSGRGPDNNSAHVTDYRLPNGADGYQTVTKISPAGVVLWSRDTFSIKEANDQGELNDIPTPPDDHHYPSIQAVFTDADNNVVVGGKPSSGVNLFKLDGNSGVIIWAQNLGKVVPQSAACLGPGGTYVVCAFRNDLWEDGSHSGDDRTLFLIDPETGDINETFDLGADASALCVAAAGTRVCFGSDRVN